MTYTPLDGNRTAILFADLQAGIIELGSTNTQPVLRRAVNGLAKLAKLFDIPVIVTTAPAAQGNVRVAPEITDVLGDLPFHTRSTTDAFLDDATRAAILKPRRTTLLIAGVATEIIVQHCALSAAARGLQAQVVIDACSGLSPRTEDAALRRLAQAGVVTTSLASVAGQMAGDLRQPKGGQAIEILYETASRELAGRDG